jgi:hypothetical protein
MGELRNVYNVSVGKHEGKGPLGRPMRRWEDNIKMDRRKIGREDVDWMHWLRIGNSGMNCQGGSMELRNVCSLPQHYTASPPTVPSLEISPP